MQNYCKNSERRRQCKTICKDFVFIVEPPPIFEEVKILVNETVMYCFASGDVYAAVAKDKGAAATVAAHGH